MLALRVNLSLAGDLPRPIASERQHVGQTGCPDAWNRARPLQHVIHIGVSLRGIGESKTRVDPHRSRPLRFKSQIQVEDAYKTPHQQARAHQQGTGKCDLGNHQPVANPCVPATPLDPRPPSFSSSPTPNDRTCRAGNKPNSIAGKNRCQQRESKRVSVQPYACEERNIECIQMGYGACASHREIRPSTAPKQDSAMLSVSICRSNRRRSAPNAARIAISFCRIPNRASCRFERFAHTMNITTATAQASTIRAG